MLLVAHRLGSVVSAMGVDAGQGRKGAFRYLDQRGQRDPRPGEARADRAARDPARLEGRLDLAERAGEAAGDRLRQGGPEAVPLPPATTAPRRSRRSTTSSSASPRSCRDLRATMAEHLDKDGLDRERVSAIALRLINLGWFRVGSERYAKESRTYGITTLTRRHVKVRGRRVRLAFRGKHRSRCARSSSTRSSPPRCGSCWRSAGRARLRVRVGGRDLQPDEQAAERLREALPRRRTSREGLPDLGRDAPRGGRVRRACEAARFPETAADEKRSVAAVMRRVAQQLGNTPAVCRASYVSPAVIDQYLEGRTIEDFRPRHLRVVGARDVGLYAEEQALLSLLRSWRIRQARAAA